MLNFLDGDADPLRSGKPFAASFGKDKPSGGEMEIGASAKAALVAVAWVGNDAKATGPNSLEFGAVWQACQASPEVFDAESPGPEDTVFQEDLPEDQMGWGELRTDAALASGESPEALMDDPSPLHPLPQHGEATHMNLNHASAFRDVPVTGWKVPAEFIYATRTVEHTEAAATPFQLPATGENALPTSRGVHRSLGKALQTRSGEQSLAEVFASSSQQQGEQSADPIAPSQLGKSVTEQSDEQSRSPDEVAQPKVLPSAETYMVETDDLFAQTMSGSARRELGKPQTGPLVEVERAIRAPLLKAVQTSESELVSSLSSIQAHARQAQESEEILVPNARFEVTAESVLGRAPNPRAGTADANISVAQQIQKQAQMLIQKEGQGFEIQLSPTELGRVRMSLLHGDAGLGLILTVERPETLDLLRRNSEVLFAEFKGAGFENLAFEFRQEHGRPKLGFAETDVPEVNASDADDTISTSAIPRRTNREGGRLDITI